MRGTVSKRLRRLARMKKLSKAEYRRLKRIYTQGAYKR